MILTVTLNPAVDKTYTTGELIPGHVNRMRSVMSFAGGKGINVTRVLRQYGYPVCATGFLGGYTGNFIEDKLVKKQVECRFVRVEGETRCSVNILADNGYVTEILEPGPLVEEEQMRQFLARYEKLLPESDLVVLSGSVARGVPEDIYVQLILLAKQNGIKTLLDTSGESLKKGWQAGPYLVKPNQKELEYIIGHKLANREMVADAARMLLESGIERVIVSMGKKGLIAVSRKHVYFAKAGRIQALNTVGCGDSVVASYAMSICKGESEEEALKNAVAISAACATTLESGDVPINTAKELAEHITIEEW